jgi:hypothetical protein
LDNRLNGKLFCIWDDLLRLFAIARVANPKSGLNLGQNPMITKTLAVIFAKKNEKKLILIPTIGIFGKNKNYGTEYINIIRRLF